MAAGVAVWRFSFLRRETKVPRTRSEVTFRVPASPNLQTKRAYVKGHAHDGSSVGVEGQLGRGGVWPDAGSGRRRAFVPGVAATDGDGGGGPGADFGDPGDA